MTIRLDGDDESRRSPSRARGCAISTAATSLLTDELVGMSREELLRLPKDFVLELLGIEISATRMKCAMLGLKISEERQLGQPAEWEDEGEAGNPSEGGRPLSRSAQVPGTATACWPASPALGCITAKVAPAGSATIGEAADRDVDRADGRLRHLGVTARDRRVGRPRP